MLISIFILLLISVVAIALIVSSGTESALAGNYRSATGVYYASLAGLEEARGRLLTNNASSFKTTAPANFSLSPLPIGYVNYVLNPGPTEIAANILTTYPDNEYASEFGAPPVPANISTTLSMWDRNPLKTSLNLPGPLYKWMRINAVSEQWLGHDVAPFDTSVDPKLLFYDGTNLNDTPSGSQVLEITALAFLPNGSQKLVQYLAAPVPITLPPFLAALTLSGSPGNSPAFHAPGTNAFYAVKGNDSLQGCSGSSGSPVAAIGLFGDYSGNDYHPDLNGIVGGIPTNASGTNTQLNYTGLGAAPPTTNPPDVEYLSTYPTNMQSPSQLDAIVQTISQNADVTIPSGPVTYPLPTVTGSALTPLGMSPSNPQTVVVNGNLNVTTWGGTGYGLLMVIGTFTYDPSVTWNGIVLVIGQGVVNNIDLGQYQQINGAVLVAKTRNTSGVLLPDPPVGGLGGASVVFTDSMQGNGIRYSSCWIQRARPTGSYQILSFHEISQ